jgi:ADP-heptose:LPS heptosyltransferase
MKRILFIRSDRFGEFLLSLPAVKLVKENFPQSQIYLLAQRDNLELVRGVNFINRFIEYKQCLFNGYRGALRLAIILRRNKIDCVIIQNPKKEFHLAALLAAVPLRVGYDRKWRFCLNKKIEDNKFLEKKHEIEYNIDLVKSLCKNVFIPDIDFPQLPEKNFMFLNQVLDINKKYIIIHPFTSNPVKKVKSSFWRELINELKNNFDKEIILLGSRGEKKEAEFLSRECGVKNLAGYMGLKTLSGFLKRNCCLCIGLDSGPMHLGSALRISTVGLFRASSVARWRPRGSSSLVIEGKTDSEFKDKIKDIIAFAKHG